MAEYYHYTLKKHVPSIVKDGLWGDRHPLYTTDVYYNASAAGQAVGVMPHYIDCVLKFTDDGKFKAFYPPTVPFTGRFAGGATQFYHQGKPRSAFIRDIGGHSLTRL
jgi:hypothetical protein